MVIKFLSALILLLVTTAAQAERIRDLTSVQGSKAKLTDWLWPGGETMVQVTRQLRRRLPHKRLITCSHSWELPFRRALICS